MRMECSFESPFIWFVGELADVNMGDRTALIEFPDTSYEPRWVSWNAIRPEMYLDGTAMKAGDKVEVLTAGSSQHPSFWTFGSVQNVLQSDDDMCEVELSHDNSKMSVPVKSCRHQMQETVFLDLSALFRESIVLHDDDAALFASPLLDKKELFQMISRLLPGLLLININVTPAASQPTLHAIGQDLDVTRKALFLARVHASLLVRINALEQEREDMDLLCETLMVPFSEVKRFQFDSKTPQVAKFLQLGARVVVDPVEASSLENHRVVRIYAPSSEILTATLTTLSLGSTVFPLRQDQVGWILGKKGSRLQALVSRTKVQSALYDSRRRGVVIVGDEKCVKETISELEAQLAMLAEHEHAVSINKFKKDFWHEKENYQQHSHKDKEKSHSSQSKFFFKNDSSKSQKPFSKDTKEKTNNNNNNNAKDNNNNNNNTKPKESNKESLATNVVAEKKPNNNNLKNKSRSQPAPTE